MIIKHLLCYLKGHHWSSVHGYRNLPDFGAVCGRCGLEAETYESWEQRWKDVQ